MQKTDSEAESIRQLQLTSDDSFPITAFLNISFTHNVAILRYAKEYNERKYYIQIAYQIYAEGEQDPERTLKKFL